MSRVFRTLAVLSLLGTSIAAQENSPWYATFGGGFHGAGDTDGPAGSTLSFDGGYSLNFGVGRDLINTGSKRFGLQGEFLFNNFDLSDEDVTAQSLSSENSENYSLMLNGIADFKLSPQLGVYAGVGVGYAAKISVDGLDQPGPFTLVDDSAVAFQFKAGFKYGLGGGYDMGFGYRYFRMDAVEVSSLSSQSFDLEFDQHVFEIVMHWGL